MRANKIKNKHAVALGRMGGKARLKTMTAEERSRRAKHAVAMREKKRMEKIRLI